MSLLHDVVEVIVRRSADGRATEESFSGDQIKVWFVKTVVTGPKAQAIKYYQITIPIPEEAND